jgi:hypothetical protein
LALFSLEPLSLSRKPLTLSFAPIADPDSAYSLSGAIALQCIAYFKNYPLDGARAKTLVRSLEECLLSHNDIFMNSRSPQFGSLFSTFLDILMRALKIVYQIFIQVSRPSSFIVDLCLHIHILHHILWRGGKT